MPLPYAAIIGTGALVGLGYFVASHWEEVQYHWNGIKAHIETERRKAKMLSSDQRGNIFFGDLDDESVTETEDNGEIVGESSWRSDNNELRLRQLTMPRTIDSVHSSQLTLRTMEGSDDDSRGSDAPSSFAVISSDSEWTTDGIS